MDEDQSPPNHQGDENKLEEVRLSKADADLLVGVLFTANSAIYELSKTIFDMQVALAKEHGILIVNSEQNQKVLNFLDEMNKLSWKLGGKLGVLNGPK